MINQSGERELAYIVKVDAVDPIPGYDRIERATVGGWHCVVGKGMKPGDLAVYFEIDSLLPASDERFAFCEKYKYRIKTQRMCKGAVISQGLLMPLSEFPELEGCAAGDGVTAELGVKYYEPEDNVRKAPTQDKYKRMAQRNGELFARQPYRWLMRRDWGKKLLFFFYGNRRDKKTGWPSWVSKTDEERCLAGKTKICTDKGDILISTIVNKKLPVSVKSVNLSTGEVEYKPIVSYQRYKISEDLYDVEFVQINKGDTKLNRVVCTGDHKFYTQDGWKMARELLTDDCLYRDIPTYDEGVVPLVFGMMLGDGGITIDKRNKNSRMRFNYTQGVQHEQYFNLMSRCFDGAKKYIMKSGYTGKPNMHRLTFEDQLCEQVLRRANCIKNGRFVITDELCNYITPLTIAVWYMDDGTLRHRDDGISSTGEISTNAFTRDENMLLIGALNKYGIEATLKYDKSRNFYSIYITAAGIKVLGKLIAPYVPSDMRYKLPTDIDNTIPFDGTLWPTSKKTNHIVEARITSVSKFVDHTNGYHVNGNVYDIEVAENHNFFANGVLTHNCQNVPWILGENEHWVATEKIDGTSTTFSMKRGHGLFHKDQFYVCSRNVVFDADGNGRCFYDKNYYTEMAEEYGMYGVLQRLLEDYPEEEWITIQGETYGSGVQKRTYGIEGRDFAAFNLVFSSCGRVGTVEMRHILTEYGVPCVPILDKDVTFDAKTVDEVIAMSDGASELDGEMREGIVYRSHDGKRSFKAVSNEYLLKYHS